MLVNDSASTWREIPPALNGGILMGAAWSGATYVAVGMGGELVTSTDAVTWTQQQAPVIVNLGSAAWSGSSWVAVGDDWAGRAAILSSPDGATWALGYQTAICNDPHVQPPVCPPQQALSKIVWDGRQFVTVGREANPWSGSLLVAAGQAADGSAAVWTSTDAVQWTRQGLPLSGQRVLRDVAWAPSGLVVVGWGGTPATANSARGILWQANQDAGPLAAMNATGAGPTQYLAVSNTAIETSAKGATWTAAPTVRPCGNAVLWDGQRWVSFGSEVCLSP